MREPACVSREALPGRGASRNENGSLPLLILMR